jgi:hypothetical protein
MASTRASLIIAVALAGCAANTSPKPAAVSAKPTSSKQVLNKDPYPSTYKPYPGVPTRKWDRDFSRRQA